MITLPLLADKTVGVLGLGKSGIATVEMLLASGAVPLVWDDNAQSMEAFAVRYPQVKTAPVESWDWQSVAMVVLSPGMPYTHPKPHAGVVLAQQHGVEIVGDIELLYRAQPDATYIAITGTNGKSTTTSLIGHILQQSGRKVQVGGNLGTPVLQFEPLGGDGVYVLELSSYQLDLVRTTVFDVSVLLNISPDHIDRHGDMRGYVAAKEHIFDRQGSDQVAVIGVDDAASEALCHQIIAEGTQRIIPIMTTQRSDQGIWVEDALLHNPLSDAELVFDMSQCSNLRGEHNHQNAAAAYAACWSVGVSHEAIIAAMLSFPGLAHRMQRVGVVDGVGCINDSKATNADAAAKSLGSYEVIYWIAGGVAKAGGIEPLGHYFPRVKKAFLIGAAQDAFAHTLEGHVAYEKSGTLDAAFAAALSAAKQDGIEGAVILLAPACASFDQYQNFEQRGDHFARLASEYAAQHDEVAHAV